MPPKKNTQAGKFKPLKRPAPKKPGASAASASAGGEAAAAASSSSGASRGRRQQSDGTSSAAAAGRGGRRGGRGRSHSPGNKSSDGRGRGRGRGGRGGGRGRDGRGRGRGRGGRAGRFIVPSGSSFFTGDAAKRSESTTPGLPGSGGPSQELLTAKVQAGTDGAVFMPGANSSRTSATANTGGGNGSGSGAPGGIRVARSTAESMAASARARAGEGEEIIVAEMLDMEGDEDEANAGKKKSVLDGPSSSMRFDGMPSLFDGEDEKEEIDDPTKGISDAFLYDSDSSVEERRVRNRNKKNPNNSAVAGGFRLPPIQLPFLVGKHQQTMYDCQEKKDEEEEKKMSEDGDGANTTSYLNLSDPPLQSPFLDLASVSEGMKQLETEPWFVMKFPTRLPHLDTSSSSSSSANSSKKAAELIKSELSEGGAPDAVGSMTVDEVKSSNVAGASEASASGPQGYDDTLKDVAAGRYGRIVVRKSGKTELIIGGGDDGTPEVRKERMCLMDSCMDD